MAAQDDLETVAGAGQFATTHWSVVVAAAGANARSREAFTRLYQIYWYPLYAFVRRNGYSPEDAQDLTQGFFASLLERQALAMVDRAKGKFRSFLLASLRHFLANQWDRDRAQKRGGGRPLLSLDSAAAERRFGLEPADPASPDKIFERNWVLRLMEEVLQRLHAEQRLAGKEAQFRLLRHALMADPDAPSYAELAARSHTTAEALRMAVLRLRRRYRELLREEIARTVASPDQVDDEIRHCFAVLGSG